MEKETIQNLFMQGMDCSQVVAGDFAQKLGMDEALLRRMSACFGGGMGRAETCGAVTGALMVLGLQYGHAAEGDAAQKALMEEKRREFQTKFAQSYPSSMCRELLGYDICKAEELEKVLEQNLMMDFCPCVVQRVLEILHEMLP